MNSKYANLTGRSGVAKYSLGPDFIKVKFKDGSRYTYTYDSAGPAKIEQMKILAKNGYGLNGFINREVYSNYSRKQPPIFPPALQSLLRLNHHKTNNTKKKG